MTNKTTRKALLLSSLSLLLCFAMLLGTTFAWFTDSVTSTNNIIKAGNLDVEVEYTLDGQNWKPLDGAADLFQKSLWEPGHTEVVALRIKNNGSLALKYTANMNIVSETVGKTKDGADIVLSDILTVSTLVQQVNAIGDITVGLAFAGENRVAYENTEAFKAASVLRENQELLPGDAHYMMVKVDMAETVGNEANHDGINVPAINFGINFLATQFTYENDSFNNQYDKDAEYVEPEKLVEKGSYGGVNWTLFDNGKLVIAPGTAVYDETAQKTYAAGEWREAVRYQNGSAKAIVDPLGNTEILNKVTSLVIEEGVTSIGSFAAKFPNLTGEVVIPSTVTYIGQEAFQNAPITKLTFASGGTGKLCIAPGAFKKIKAEEIVFPADRPEIHIHCWAFNDCTSLKRVTFPANVTTFSNWTHVEYCGMSSVNGYDSQIFARCTALEKLTFGSQEVHDRFFNAAGNRSNINAIGSVEIEIQ